jgi:hypothetical protein
MQKRDSAAPMNIPRMIQGGSMPLGFPDKLLSKLRYHETGTITSLLGGITKQNYRWNSTFDPNQTGGGHQPLYRDTYAAIYDHYAVVSAVATITFVNYSTSPFIVGCVTDDDTSTGGIDVVCEMNHGYHKLIPPLLGSLSSHTFTVNWDCKRVLTIDPYTSQTYKTNVGTDPSEESILTLFGSAADGASSAQVYYDFELTQTVLWTELTTPTGS